MAQLQVQDLSKSFPGRSVLQDIQLLVDSGEFLVLVGPSGCGKSTLLRILAGLESADRGTVQLGDRILNDLEPRERNVAMVFQNYALYPHMTVRKNLSFPLRLAGQPANAIHDAVARIAKTLNLEEHLEQKPATLSGGQMQRVALGRAMIRNPKLFLFDEPLSNLDAKLRNETRGEIVRLQRELGITTVYVTHDQAEAMTMGDRICVLHEGRIQQLGPPLEVYQRPANPFVAGFIGSPPMNLLAGHVHRGVFRCHWLQCSTPVALPDGAWTLGFRAHDVPTPGQLVAPIRRREALGNESHYFLGDDSAEIMISAAGAPAVAVGESWSFDLPNEIQHWFQQQDQTWTRWSPDA